ncbi:hypothetical protein E2562_007767 [Oryza meyeriana var. granulata]|uniref:Uncharacterized protein n=1 Tax=Oryza meyeriana var. granulata TaxID=110450 RepID=A0A6G1EGP5_9ORYZ|nr:hypothetical protein E2562_007767 [Oryza meyeriana var. granulata]
MGRWIGAGRSWPVVGSKVLEGPDGHLRGVVGQEGDVSVWQRLGTTEGRWEVGPAETWLAVTKLVCESMSSSLSMASAAPEPPFGPREKLVEKQRYFQSVHKPTYLKGRYDAITSVAIPLALAASSMFLVGRGIYNMSHGIGKKE